MQAIHQASLVRQVIHHRSRVREWLQAGKGRATLKVHQNQRQLIGMMVDDLSQNDGAQHLRLTRTGRTHT